MSEQATFPVGARVRVKGREGGKGVVIAQPFGHAGYHDHRYVRWEDGTNRWHDVDSLECEATPAPEPASDDSAGRSKAMSGEQEQFPAGTRVRHRCAPSVEGVVADPPSVHQGYPGGYPEARYVRWDDGAYLWHNVVVLERADTPEPPRAPARTLAPGIEQSDDVCDGRPRIAGTGISTQALYAFWNEARIDWPDIKNSYDVTAEQHHLAIAFEAGRAWERERRRRRKEKRAVRRYERAKALAEAEGANQ